VAEGTKIRIQFLKAIEEDRLHDLPSLSQAKGFSRLYASFLGLNPMQVFDEVEKANRPAAEPEPTGESAEQMPDQVVVENHETNRKRSSPKPPNRNGKKSNKGMRSLLRRKSAVAGHLRGNRERTAKTTRSSGSFTY
jgi:cytoskeletal protein RodZ